MNNPFLNLVLSIGVLASVSNSFASISVECPQGSGPSEKNLTVIIDDEEPDSILQIGFAVMGTFFEMRMTGCHSLSIKNGSLVCDQNVIGSVGRKEIATEDPFYDGPRANVLLNTNQYDIVGSCNPAHKNPLQIMIHPN